jgi:hypothetical protein
VLAGMRRDGNQGGLGGPFSGRRFWPPVPRLWAGETVVICASGPSITRAQAEYCKGKARLIAINNTYQLAPWAYMLYACDHNWWAHYRPEFSGLKVTQDERAAQEFGVLRVPSVDEPGLSLDPLRIHQGGNGGYQAINLAALLGAARIILLGYDMHGDHWHGQHVGMNNPDAGNFKRWIAAFRTIESPVPIINCTPGSALDCFPTAQLEDTL